MITHFRCVFCRTHSPVYGTYAFEDLRAFQKDTPDRRVHWFVDNTRWLTEIDEGMCANKNKELLFLRPSGFGKSLFLSTMRAYFSKHRTREEWKELFRGLDCYQPVTEAWEAQKRPRPPRGEPSLEVR